MKLKSLLSILLIAVLALTVVGCGAASDDKGDQQGAEKVDFPTKSVQLIVPYSAGGGTDSVARALADATKDHLGQAVAVVNKTGGGGAVGMTEGANSKADGYTVTMVTVELTTLPNLGLATISHEDFKPIAQINSDSAAITVQADAPWNTIEEFIQYAKENPGKVQVGNSGTGAIWHLAAAALGTKTEAQFNHIPFEGAAPAVTSLLGGHIQAVSVSPAEVASQVANGQLKVLAVMSDERIESMPDVPTLKEKGIDLSIGTWRGLAVPSETPDEIANILTEAFTNGAKEQAFVDFMKEAGLGYKLTDGNTFKQRMITEHNLFAELIPALGLKK